MCSLLVSILDSPAVDPKSNGHWYEADWLHNKCDALCSNRKVAGSRLTGNTQACLS